MFTWLRAILVSLLLILAAYYLLPHPRNRFIIDRAPWALLILVPWLAWEWIKITNEGPHE